MTCLSTDYYTGKTYSRTIPPQGMTSSVVILHAERGDFVLKQADRTPYTAWLQREAFVLQALAASNLPIPHYIAVEEQPTSTSLLMTALPGEPLSALLRRGVSDEMRHDLLHQFGQLLAQIHTATPAPVLQAQRPWLERILDEARNNQLKGYAEPEAPPIETMLTTRPPAIAEVLIHGDYTIDNVLVDAGKLTGVIDWGRGDIGDPRYDLTLATRLQEPESAFLNDADFTAFYTGYGGKRLSQDEHQWFDRLYDYF
ncbi:MAG: phosphotransferase [Caldilineaceae bacterium]